MATFLLSETEFLEAQQLFSRLTPRRVATAVVAGAICFVFVAPMLGFGWVEGAFVALGGMVGGIIASLATRTFVLPRGTRKIFAQQRGLKESFEFSWDESGISYSSALGQSKTPWSHYHSFREGASVFILFVSDNLFHMVPKRVFDGVAEVHAFRDLCERLSGRVDRK